MALYYIWHPPAACRKLKAIKQLQAEVDAAKIMIDRNGHTFQIRDGVKVAVPRKMVPKKVRLQVAQQFTGTTEGFDESARESGHQPRRPGQPALPATSS